jgi:two-component system response regulator YesN
MLKLLIADDEKAIRETISSLIDWKSLDIELIGTAKNGIESYNMILDQYPDIVLTDIKMPGLSGLDLIQKMYEINKDTQFIILSGYNEFEYAKTAMQYGVKHYLLKPCSEEQIIESIQKIKEDFKQKQVTKHIAEEHFQLKQQMNSSMIINIVNQYLACETGETLPAEDNYFTDYYKHLGQIDNKYEVFYLYFIEDANFEEALRLLSAFWESHYPGVLLNIFYVHNSMLFFFESFSSSYEEIENWGHTLHFSTQNTSPVLQHFSFTGLTQTLHKISGQIRRYEKIYYSNGYTITTIGNYNNLIRDIQDSVNRLFDFETSTEQDLTLWKETILHINDFNFLKQVTPSIVMTAVSKLPSFNTVNAVELLIELEKEFDLDSYKKKLLEKIENLYQQSRTDTSTGEISDHIKRYVLTHLSNPELSLKWIAENELFMNVDYISKKFVKETGQKFSAYLTEVRIQKAKDFLSSADSDKMQDIAELVGCGNNPQYFSQIFKKSTGKTPSQYLKMIQGK